MLRSREIGVGNFGKVEVGAAYLTSDSVTLILIPFLRIATKNRSAQWPDIKKKRPKQ